jgi:hypothetical protein
VKLFLKNKNILFAKNHCEFHVRTILVCTLYSIKYGTSRIINDDSRVMLQTVASLIGNSRDVIYDHNVFIVHATGFVILSFNCPGLNTQAVVIIRTEKALVR